MKYSEQQIDGRNSAVTDLLSKIWQHITTAGLVPNSCMLEKDEGYSHLYLPTLFFISHWWIDSDLAGKIDMVTQEYLSYRKTKVSVTQDPPAPLDILVKIYSRYVFNIYLYLVAIKNLH